jgi:hypothetical protein
MHPTGPSSDNSICPPGEPLGSFEDNTAHSNVRYGFRVFNQWVPVDGDACRWGSESAQMSPRTAHLVRFTSYKNGRSGANKSPGVYCQSSALTIRAPNSSPNSVSHNSSSALQRCSHHGTRERSSASCCCCTKRACASTVRRRGSFSIYFMLQG